MRAFRTSTLAVVLATGSALIAIPASASSAYDPFFATPQVVADVAAVPPVSSSSNRDFGVAAGDFDGDNKVDAVVGRTDGRVVFLKGNGDGTFAVPSLFAWKLETFNAWAFAAGDVNGDGKLDVIYGANAAGADTGGVIRVNDGDVRYLVGVGDGSFETTNNYVRLGITFNAGTLIADVGTDTGSVAAGYLNADGVLDVVVGTLDGTTTTVKVLLGTGGGAFGPPSILISQATTCAAPCSPIYFPATLTQNSPWGLAIGDADGDSDADLFVTDRALYSYLYRNDGAASFTLQGANGAVSGRPNVYLGHDTFRAAVGYTASTAAGDVNGDGKADLFLGLQSGTQTPASNISHDGKIVLDVSAGSGHTGFGALADIGTEARGVTLVDVNGDAALDVVTGNYEGQFVVMRQLTPVDVDADGISDYVDNAPIDPNAPRLDMNTDASINHRDQLDNDFDTVLGNPEDQTTWQRLGDVVDADDDNDGDADGADNCVFTANPAQEDVDVDGIGDACDPLDGRDRDGDGVPTGPMPGDPLYQDALDAKILWSQGSTHFVIRIDALGRFFQNEFTQIMTDAATLSPADWAAKCWENYDPGDVSPTYEPCGDDTTKTLTLEGGKGVPITLVVIPKQLWTDPPVVTWINDRNDDARFELGQHGTYHANNTVRGDWAAMSDRNFYSCENCGLTLAENYELLRVGYDTLMGNYGNKWVAESGATGASPTIDWSSSANPLISYSPPFNASDTVAREAIAQLGYKAFSASVFEEDAPGYSEIFSPEGGHHEQFDQFGMYHASADLQLNPPDTTGDTYDQVGYESYLQANTDDGGLTTWLIEEVDWSGRPCPNNDRLGTCNGGSNREDNTVYLPRWSAWMQLLDYVKTYPDGVAMTMGDVALAQGYDNAPTVVNPGQADGDHDGVGDAIDGAALTAADLSLSRNVPGTLSATLLNGSGDPIVGQEVVVTFDADGNGTDETQTVTTDESGLAEISVTPTRQVGPATYTVAWDGLRATATDTGDVVVGDATTLTLDELNPASGQITDAVSFGATLVDTDGASLEGMTVTFTLGAQSAEALTDPDGHVSVLLTLQAPTGSRTLQATFAGMGHYGTSNDTASFTVNKENTTLTMPDAVGTTNRNALAQATLREDGNPVVGKTISFYVKTTLIGTATTNASGVASFTVPAKYVHVRKQAVVLRAVFAGDAVFLGAEANAFVYRV